MGPLLKMASILPQFNSRIHTHFFKTLQYDLISLYSCRVSIPRIELSISIPQNILVKDPNYYKYRTAAFLELLTGSVPNASVAKIELTDPLIPKLSANEKLMLNRFRGRSIRESQVGVEKAAKKKEKKVVGIPPREMELLNKGKATGLVLDVSLDGNDEIFGFLEKCRECFVADEDYSGLDGVMGLKENYWSVIKSNVPGVEVGDEDERGVRKLIGKKENPLIGSPLLVIRARDTLRFPDVELFVEGFSDIVVADKEKLNILVNPWLEVHPMGEQSVNHLAVMEHVIKSLFSSFIRRPKLPIPEVVKEATVEEPANEEKENDESDEPKAIKF